MDERDIFIAALEIATPQERSDFIRVACGGDSQLRQSVEALLQTHERTGDFLQKPLVERLAEGVAALEEATEAAHSSAGRQRSAALGFLSPSDQPGSIGRLGHYEVLEEIGRGGMGIVLRAFDQRLHRVVAVKVMAGELATNAAACKRFLREARAAAAVCHDHIITIYAVEESGELPYLVMQCVSGMSLQQRIDRDGPLALHQILRIGMQAAAGLAAAHAQGLIHRDIKPANILLENGVERVKITDFGLARAAADASISQTGIVAGTPQYMAPEQARGEALDYRADLFSLGSVLYAMCTGRAPFRAANSMAVLKRVCDDNPSPIREANSEVPDWLVALIDKLQAKNPDGRYQSAAEVADILGHRLAQLQHSAPLPPLATPKPATVRPAPRSWRLWAAAAAILLLLAATFGLAEGTGISNIATTVIRLFTPEGTLIVEINDPAVNVTVEGDGGLVITGAGLHEFHLRPGNYRLQADKNGRPVALERELVSIAKGGREVVRVKLEAGPAPAIAGSQKGAFVLVGGQGVAERKFGTLAEAVQGASDGDTIEVRGNGPFVSDGVTTRHPLVIRAGTGFAPSITLSKASADKNFPLITVIDALALEGLELRREGGANQPVEDRFPTMLFAREGGSLHVSNCRLIYKADSPDSVQGTIFDSHAKSLSVQNSVLSMNIANESGWFCQSGGRYGIENCVCAIGGVVFSPRDSEVRDVSVSIRNNTLVGNCLNLTLFSKPNLPAAGDNTPPIRLECSRNVARWDASTRNQCFLFYHQAFPEPLSADQAEALLPRLIALAEKQNVYQNHPPLLDIVANWNSLLLKRDRDLADWDRFWAQQNTGSVEGEIRFQGGDLVTKARTAPELITADDFRLRPDSAGYRAGKDGKDLGADVDLVGPGAAYERWRKTPEYQTWLKDTGQLRAEAPQPELGAFVRLGGKGVSLRKFDTLAEAVQSASDGDTIEVRGNGPFVTETVTITAALTIRAGEGFRPVINLSGKAAQNDQPLFETRNRLVLEGLELFRPKGSKTGTMVISYSGPLVAAANCRFRAEGVAHCIWTADSSMTRNCVFLGGEGFATINGAIPNGAKYIMENCVDIGTPVVLHSRADTANVSIRLTHNTILANGIGIEVGEMTDVPPGEKGPKPIRFDVSGSIFRSDLLWVRLHPAFLAKRKGFEPETSGDALLRSLMEWSEHENLHSPGNACLTWVMGQAVQPSKRFKSLAEWHDLWGLSGTGSLEGRAKFEGGDVLARFAAAPDQLTPEDFRLRADSRGYRAGSDGKDLGADVDLVGPGAAYERWKKTSDYQTWLKDTGQVRSEIMKPETGAFVVLGGKGVAERKFDTLADAASNASDGDTIEICGNGPFVTEPVNLGKKVLTIRAATGFQPIIKGNADSTVEGGSILLQCQGPLVLEGLELQMTGPAGSTTVHSLLAPVHIANCRFALHGGVSLWTGDSPLCTVRNCQFVAKMTGYLQIPIVSQLPNNGKLILENNLLSGPCHHGLELVWHRPDLHNVAVNLNHNTVATLRVAIVQGLMSLPESAEAGAAPDRQAVQMHVSSNLFESMNSSEHMLSLLLPPDWYDNDAKPLSPTEAEGLLPRLMAWREERNLYSSGLSFQTMRRVKEPRTPEREFIDEPLAAYQTFADWQHMWKTGDSGSAEGVIRYEGGDVLAKFATDPDRLTPEDFRLRSDSAGYKAGKDGKDLGADVDLVGPGAAYERWKKTPEYQEWLKETGQEK